MKKQFPAFVAAFLMTGLIALAMAVVTVNALVNKNSTPAANSATASTSADASQVAQLQDLVQQYQQREQEYQQREQQYQQLLDQEKQQLDAAYPPDRRCTPGATLCWGSQGLRDRAFAFAADGALERASGSARSIRTLRTRECRPTPMCRPCRHPSRAKD